MEAVLETPLAETRPLAAADLYRDHVRAVTRWVRSLAGPGADADDLVQETFAVALRRLASFRGEARLETWLFGIARNVVRAERRRARFRRLWSRPADEAGELPSPGRAPDRAMEDRELRILLYRALDGLPERQRTAFILFEIEELSGEDVAERMGVKPGNLWVLLHRARAELARRLDLQQRSRP